MMMADLFSRRPSTSVVRAFVIPLAIVVGLQMLPTAQAALRHPYTFNTPVAALGTFQDTAPGGDADGVLFNNPTISRGALILPGAGTGHAATTDHAELKANDADPLPGTQGVNINTFTNATFSVWATTNTTPNVAWARYFHIGGTDTVGGGNGGSTVFMTPDRNVNPDAL